MAIRNSGSSTLQLGQLRDRIRSTFFTRTDQTDADSEQDARSRPNPDAPGNLFHCSSCGTVYIDSEKDHCSDCEEGVEEVRSELKPSEIR